MKAELLKKLSNEELVDELEESVASLNDAAHFHDPFSSEAHREHVADARREVLRRLGDMSEDSR